MILWLWTPWAKYRYQGPGTFTDRGFFSYPRYEAQLGNIPLSKAGEYQYFFLGLPGEEMDLLLELTPRVAYNSKEWHDLEQLRIPIQAVIREQHGGKEVCRASGTTEDNNSGGVWVLTSGYGSAFWHHQCNQVQFHSNRSYQLTLTVSRADPAAENLVVAPTLVGGGIELP